jgi:hypothetical protein
MRTDDVGPAGMPGKWRRLRFSLRGMFVAVTLFALLCAFGVHWRSTWIRDRQEFIERFAERAEKFWYAGEPGLYRLQDGKIVKEPTFVSTRTVLPTPSTPKLSLRDRLRLWLSGAADVHVVKLIYIFDNDSMRDDVAEALRLFPEAEVRVCIAHRDSPTDPDTGLRLWTFFGWVAPRH